MTSFLPANTVTGIRAATQGLFWDKGRVDRYTAPSSKALYGHLANGTYGDYDDEHPALAIETDCKVSMGQMGEAGQNEELGTGRGTVMFPASMEGSVSKLDRFVWLENKGTALTRQLKFEILGEPTMALLGLKADIRLSPDPS